MSYRIRFRPQPSINLKLPHSKLNNIWSRYEYSCKIDEKLSESELLDYDCTINMIMQQVLEKQNLRECLSIVGKLNTYRIGFNICDKQRNILGQRQLIGVAFFDKTVNLKNLNEFYEFEMESYEQTDVYACPYIFERFKNIGDFLLKKGFLPSKNSKYYRCLSEKWKIFSPKKGCAYPLEEIPRYCGNAIRSYLWSLFT